MPAIAHLRPWRQFRFVMSWLPMILLLQHSVMGYITREKDDESALIKQLREEVVDDLSTTYQDTCTKKDLTVVTLLDPRFKSTPFLSDKDRLDAYHELTVQAVFASSSVKPKAAVKVDAVRSNPVRGYYRASSTSNSTWWCHDDLPSPAKKMRLETRESESVKDKPTAMSSLFGDVYITPVKEQKSEQDICKT